MVLLQGISIIVISFVILGLGMYIRNLANRKVKKDLIAVLIKKQK